MGLRVTKKKWIVLILVIGIYPAFKWDYYLSNYLFKQYCEDEGRIGLFIYENVQLNGKYFMPFPADKEPRDLGQRFIFGENLMLNRKRFDKDFNLEDNRVVPLSSIGPINAYETLVIRKVDQKVLGKAVSAKNGQGWLNRLGVLGGFSGEMCPTGRDEKGYSNYWRAHLALVKKVFTYAKQGE